MIVVAVVMLVMAVMFFEMLRTPAGIEREHRIEQGKDLLEHQNRH